MSAENHDAADRQEAQCEELNGDSADFASNLSAAPDATEQTADKRFPVVGIGASAGGLAAFEAFFAAMPSDTGIAFVLIPHLSPTHESLLPELLANYTSMQVLEALDGMPVEPNRVHVIPPNQYLTIVGGVLHIAEMLDRQASPSHFDVFLRSLAADQKERTIAVVLSGTGQSGVQGLNDVKSAGGMAIAQEPTTAEFPSMPQAAIDAGLADYVLPVEQMPAALLSYVSHFHANREAEKAAEAAAVEPLAGILSLLRDHAKLDFRPYRMKTLVRRIERRMGLKHIENLADYCSYLSNRPAELKQLAKDLLINVTSFFRDPEAFKVLETKVIPELVSGKPTGSPNRVWVPGCATGEEAYSIAMLFLEYMTVNGTPRPLQVFATDAEEESLAIARNGVYSQSIAAQVSKDRLNRFFKRTDDVAHMVSPLLRETVTFAAQNLLSDPPFSRLDLISCRNVLIYLEPEVQQRVVALFHFALKPGGYLLLGASETVGRHADVFEMVSKKWRLYRRVGAPRLDRIAIPAFVSEPAHPAASLKAPVDLRPTRYAHLAQQMLLAQCVPAAVLVNHAGEILYFQGSTRDYLDQPTGTPTHNLLAMARSGLPAALNAAIRRAIRERSAVVGVEAYVEREEGRHAVRLTVVPSDADDSAAEPLLLVVFQEGLDLRSGPIRSENDAADYVHQLERELLAARKEQQRAIDELQASNEDSRTAGEEMLSLNEELQSANEELETSKEELQSLNEELTAVNAELREKVDGLETSNNDLANLLNSTDTATVFLTRDGRVRRFTPAAVRLFHLIAADIGRPLRDIAPRFVNQQLMGDVERVLRELIPCEKEMQTSEGNWFLQRVLPYRTVDDRIEGVVIVFSDVTVLKQAEAARKQNRELKRLAEALRESNDAVQIRDLDGEITDWNRGSERLYGYTEAEAVGMNVRQFIPATCFDAERELRERLLRGEAITFWETQRLTKGGKLLDVWMTANTIRNDEGAVVAISTVERDITQRKLEAAALRHASKRLATIMSTAVEGIITIDEFGTIESFNAAAEGMFLYSAREAIGRNISMLMPPPYNNEHNDYLADYRQTNVKKIIGNAREVFGLRRDKTTFPMDLSVSEARDGDRRVFTGIVRDITERRKAEQERLSSAIIRSSNDAIIGETNNGVITDWNPAAERLYGYSAPEAVGKPVTFLCVADCLDEFRRFVDGAGQGASVRDVETIRVRKDGQRIEAALSLDPIRDETGAIVGIMDVSRDISDRKMLERELLDEERWRFGQDLHDEIGQELTGLAFVAETALAELSRENRPEARLVTRVASGIKDALSHVRFLSRRYIPLEVDGAGLEAALAELATRSKATFGVECRFSCDGVEASIEKPRAGHLFRIAQEALTNSIKHGRATAIEIRLDLRPRYISLSVQDNGIGFPEVRDATDGMGMRIMRHRAGLINAILTISTAPVGGALVECVIDQNGSGPSVSSDRFE